MSLRVGFELVSTSAKPSEESLRAFTELLTTFGLHGQRDQQVRDELHGSARTTTEQRKYIQQSVKSQRQLAKELGLNPKTIAKWKALDRVNDAAMGPKRGSSRVLTDTQKSKIARHCAGSTESLDVLLSELQSDKDEPMPHLTRSTLYRCLRESRQRPDHGPNSGISREIFDVRQLRLKPDGDTAVYVTSINRG